MEKVIALPTAGLLLINKRKLLLAYSKNKQCFYLPGGKIDDGESPAEALCREAAEELNITIAIDELEYYTHITAPAFGEQNGVIMEQDCFLLKKEVQPVAAAEIGALDYFSLQDYYREKQQAPGVIMVLKHLQTAGLID